SARLALLCCRGLLLFERVRELRGERREVGERLSDRLDAVALQCGAELLDRVVKLRPPGTSAGAVAGGLHFIRKPELACAGTRLPRHVGEIGQRQRSALLLGGLGKRPQAVRITVQSS